MFDLIAICKHFNITTRKHTKQTLKTHRNIHVSEWHTHCINFCYSANVLLSLISAFQRRPQYVMLLALYKNQEHTLLVHQTRSYHFTLTNVHDKRMGVHNLFLGRQWCDIFHNHWWTASIKPRRLFSLEQTMLPEGFPFHQFNFVNLFKASVLPAPHCGHIRKRLPLTKAFIKTFSLTYVYSVKITLYCV